MNETLRNWSGRITAFWNRWTPAQKRNILIALIAAVICLIVILWLVLQPRYVTVAEGLDNKSLGEVDQQLQTLKIPDKVVGSAIEVPASQADKARVQLAMVGLPKQGYIGYSSVQNSFGMTSDQFNLQVLDALQQSLNETIQSIDGIESAQVHIVMPDQQLFVSQPDSTAKASVFVQVGSGVTLSRAQVAGIQQLVAHAVKGLTPDNVTVVDQNGVTLSSDAGSSETAGLGVSGELKTRQEMEQGLQSQLTQYLSEVLGPGNSVVMVHANVSFDQVTSQSHIYQPAPGSATGLPSSTQSDKKSSSTTTGGMGGAAGQSSGSNPGTASYAGSTSGGGNSTSSETQTSTQYDNSYTDTNTVVDPIQIKGYTVSVLLNSNNKALTSAVVQQIRNFVATSVGQTSGQNAQNDITVSAVPFTQASSSSLKTSSNSLWMWAALGLLLLGGGWLVVRSRRKKSAAMGEPVSSSVAPQEFFESLENVPMSDDERIRNEISKVASKKPDEFASLLRTWLTND